MKAKPHTRHTWVEYPSFSLWLLIFLMIFLGLGGLYGGIIFLADPSGVSLQMEALTPFLYINDYTLPGLFLLGWMGIAPLLLTYALLARPNWTWINTTFRWTKHHWAWSGTVAIGLLLICWLLVQGKLIGFRWPIQYVTAANGILIILLALLPNVRRTYKLPLAEATD